MSGRYTLRAMVKLRRIGSGIYETLDGRYRVEHQDGLTECEHPMCDVLHRKWHEHAGTSGWTHSVSYVAWHVWDTEKDDYATHHEFDYKREAHQWLDGHLAMA